MLIKNVLLAITWLLFGSLSVAWSSEESLQLAQAETSTSAPEKEPVKTSEDAEPSADAAADEAEAEAEEADVTESGNYDEEDDGIVYTKEVSADQLIDFPVDI